MRIKGNASRGLNSIAFGTYRFKPLTDVNGRNTGKEIYNGENKLTAEYITYRKAGAKGMTVAEYRDQVLFPHGNEKIVSRC